MSLTANELLQMKDKIRRLQTQRDQATGAIDQLKTRLKTEFGVKSLGEAKKKLETLTASRDKAQTELDAKVREFKDKYGV